MTNLPLMFQPLAKYAEFNGRSRRSEFWLWVLFRCLLGLVLAAIVGVVMVPVATQIESNPEGFVARYLMVMPLVSLVNLGLLLPTLAVGVRRLHDINRTGWWIVMPFCVSVISLIAFVITMGGGIVEMASTAEAMSEADTVQFALSLFGSILLMVGLPILIAQIVMLVFYVTDGTRGPNRFGDDPKGRGTTSTGAVS